MNKQIIPNIFALDDLTFKRKHKILSFSDILHIDFMDGKFTKDKSLTLDKISLCLQRKKKYHLHLMAYNPIQYVDVISKINPKVVYIHIEAFLTNRSFERTIKVFQEKNIEVGVAINPNTDIREIFYYANKVKHFLIMSVVPGMEGQLFLDETYERVQELKSRFPFSVVAVDGGVNANNILNLSQNGADIMYIGSAISSKPNPLKEYENIVNQLEKTKTF